ncbi:hypothetical protein QE152_g34218 [Popillia japonica]|uniref:Uncharacterized protein n=1 Tax=Popillia japonica TaxID=7064 RepID=A0AAW1IUL3_POPJA
MLEEKYQQITEYHTSRFLGLYVLSDDVEMLKKRVICLRPTCPYLLEPPSMLKKRVICLRPTCPYLLEPPSSFKKCCDYLVLATIIVQSLVLPYLCFFFKRLNAVEDGWLYMLDVICIFGLYLEMSTGVKTHEKTLMKVSEIFIYKGKHFTSLVDIFSTIPLQMVASLMGLKSLFIKANISPVWWIFSQRFHCKW